MATTPPALPNFLIIGATRSGTSSLAYHLRGHPDVFFSRDKELHFFTDRYELGLDWYRYQFAGSNGCQAVGEGTATYLYEPVALERMAEVVPGARLIAALRDPVDRAYAHYWHEVRRDRERLSFPDAVAAEPERPPKTLPTTARPYPGYLDRGRYIEQLERVCRLFPREALHVVLFEDLRDRPEDVFGGVCRFLGIDPARLPENLDKVVEPYVELRSRWLRDRTRTWPKPLRDLVGRYNAVKAGYPPMDAELRASLGRRFEPDNQALAEWLGRDLSAWRR